MLWVGLRLSAGMQCWRRADNSDWRCNPSATGADNGHLAPIIFFLDAFHPRDLKSWNTNLISRSCITLFFNRLTHVNLLFSQNENWFSSYLDPREVANRSSCYSLCVG